MQTVLPAQQYIAICQVNGTVAFAVVIDADSFYEAREALREAYWENIVPTYSVAHIGIFAQGVCSNG